MSPAHAIVRKALHTHTQTHTHTHPPTHTHMCIVATIRDIIYAHTLKKRIRSPAEVA